MKNWSTQTKTIIAILIVVILVLVAYQMKWFGNTNTLFAMGGRVPVPNPNPTPAPIGRPGSILINPNPVVTKQNACQWLEDLCAKEAANTGNTNGKMCDGWKKICGIGA